MEESRVKASGRRTKGGGCEVVISHQLRSIKCAAVQIVGTSRKISQQVAKAGVFLH